MSLLKKPLVPKLAAMLLGLIYFVFGLNGLFPFLPMERPPMPEAAQTYMAGLMATGYFFPLLKITETLFGLLLLIGKFAAPLALVVLAPITLQIFLFHFIMTPGMSNQVMPVAMIVLHVVAATGFWSLYKPLFGSGK